MACVNLLYNTSPLLQHSWQQTHRALLSRLITMHHNYVRWVVDSTCLISAIGCACNWTESAGICVCYLRSGNTAAVVVCSGDGCFSLCQS